MSTNNSWNNQIAAADSAITLNSGTNAVSVSTDASATTVNIATGGAVKTATFGSTNSTSTTTVQSGSGALNVTSTNGALTVNSGTGTLGISTDASATTVNFATGSAVKTVTLGSTNTTSSTAIKSGSGNIALNSGLTVDSSGRTTNSVQPAFTAWMHTTASNVTGDATSYTVIFDSELFDQGSIYNTSTGVFTAPIAGKYFLTCQVMLSGLTTSHVGANLQFVTTSNTFLYFTNLGVSNDAGFNVLTFNALVPMAATDTAHVAINVNGSTKTVSVYGDGTNKYSFFSCYLVC